jgi:hypothetical protein
MALKLHPDVGGSHEDMVRLNAVAAELRHIYKPPKPKRKMRKSTELRHFLKREVPRSRDQRRMQQSNSWGCWVGDGRAEEWITGPAHPIYNSFRVDLGYWPPHHQPWGAS